MKEHKPTWPALVCTRCGGGLEVELDVAGPAYSSYNVVDCISCDRCGAEWSREGRPKLGIWLRDLDENPIEEGDET